MEYNTFRISAYLPESKRKQAEGVRAMLQGFGIYTTIEEVQDEE